MLELTLKAARINKGLTQEEAGKKIGVSADVISNWERQISFPDVIPMSWLLFVVILIRKINKQQIVTKRKRVCVGKL